MVPYRAAVKTKLFRDRGSGGELAVNFFRVETSSVGWLLITQSRIIFKTLLHSLIALNSTASVIYLA